jgi:hypothetical protein
MKNAKVAIGAVMVVFAGTTMVIAQTNTFPSTGKVFIGITQPLKEEHKQQLSLGSGNIMLPNAHFGNQGNLYFGGITHNGETGLRLFGGLVNNKEPAGFIDVRTTAQHDGLRIRVDTVDGGKERMRVTASGDVVIGPEKEPGRLDVRGMTRTISLQVTGGSDLAEPFEVAAAQVVKPGMLVSIDPMRSGQLRISDHAYDRTVAGVVSGANNLNPGFTMGHDADVTDGFLPVALTGRVYALADAGGGPITPGDLLTTSDNSGYAMKVTDHAKAQGAIIGKAMSSLPSGRGLVLVLISLQ